MVWNTWSHGNLRLVKRDSVEVKAKTTDKNLPPTPALTSWLHTLHPGGLVNHSLSGPVLPRSNGRSFSKPRPFLFLAPWKSFYLLELQSPLRNGTEPNACLGVRQSRNRDPRSMRSVNYSY